MRHVGRVGRRAWRGGTEQGARRWQFAGIRGLVGAEDWGRVSVEAHSEVEALRGSLGRLSSLERLRALDAMSNRLCCVVDAAELCRSVHPSKTMREAAGAAFEACASYMDTLNGDRAVYEAAAAVTLPADAPAEAKELAAALKAEFERDGIHLSGEARRRVADSRRRCRGLEAALLEVADDAATSERPDGAEAVVVAGDVDAVKQAERELGGVAAGAFEISRRGDRLYALDGWALHAAMRRLSDGEVRRRCFETIEAERADADANAKALVEALTNERHDAARALDADSFAELTVRGPPRALLDSADRVAAFLCDAVQKVVETSGKGSSRVEPWDAEFLLSRARMASVKRRVEPIPTRPLLPRLGGRNPRRVPRYSTDACIAGLAAAAEKALGVAVSPRGRNDSENDRRGCWADDVTRLEVRDAVGDVLGLLFLDLHHRPGKQATGAGHFTVRCGCDVSGDLDSPFSAVPVATWGFSTASSYGRAEKSNPRRQLPVVALVASFDGSGRVSHHDLETLFHEWGHALHSILSRTSSQHLAGTRGATDAVELASTLLEACAWHPRVLASVLAADGSDDPDADADAALAVFQAAHTADAPFQNATQLRLAVFDQLIHGNRRLLGSEEIGSSATFDVDAALAAAHHLVPVFATPFHSDLLNLAHIATAPATYYAYPYDRALAASFAAAGLFDLDAPAKPALRQFLAAGALGRPDAPLIHHSFQNPLLFSQHAGS